MWLPGFILDNVSLTICAVALASMLYANSGKSNLISLAVWVALGVIMNLSTEALLITAQENPSIGWSLWFGSWVIFDVIGVLLIYMLHHRLEVAPGRLASFISMSFVFLAVLQLIGYLDRGVLKWKVAVDFHRHMVLAVNIAIVPAILLSMRNELSLLLLKIRSKKDIF